MPDLISRIAAAKKELGALKAGFAGGQKTFFPAITTSQVFTITTAKPVIIAATFEFNDFPELYTSVQFGGPPVIFNFNAFVRQSLYQWRMADHETSAVTYTISALLVSQRPPLTFTCGDES